MIEDDLLNMESKMEKEENYAFLAPTGKADGQSPRVIWRRVTLSGKQSKRLPRIALILAEEARKKAAGRVRLGIPVEIRPRKPGLRSTSNLTNAILRDIHENSTISNLSHEISESVEQRMDRISTLWRYRIAPHVPISLIVKAMRYEIKKRHDSGNYGMSAFLSNLGRIPQTDYVGGGFETTSCCFIPPGIGSLPLFMALAGMGASVNLVVSMPSVPGSNGRLEELLEGVAFRLASNER